MPEETRRVAQAAFPRGHVYTRLRDEFGAIPANTAITFVGGASNQTIKLSAGAT